MEALWSDPCDGGGQEKDETGNPEIPCSCCSRLKLFKCYIAPIQFHATPIALSLMTTRDTFVWKKISTTGVSPIPWDSHTCSSYKNCFVVMGGEDSGNPETMAWWERLVFGRLRIPLVLGLLHVSPLQEIPWTKSEAYYSSMRDVTKSLKLWMTCISLLLTLLPFLTIWLLFFCEEMLREKDPSEPKLSMHKELKRRRQKYRATPFVLDKQQDAEKSLVSSHGGICGKPWTSPIFPCQTHATEFQAHVQLLGEKMFEARESDVFNYGYTLEASINGKLFRGLLF
ncbi:uncharacterized protein LOC9642760 [Selaginella moellendorffii]|uniref:uncharacterized protein LOC9642760 n=1 Tax=Selaginella moellendorffii TaxID=88036 RepID=UPI000D1C5903|nr:uncharacterized protein LOC9642760 [Selaginella moellendorffii]|eukprot:XP_024531699.1 uncharacterized protein LOC9642760 [Selaginella moellendorffii]